MEYVKLTQENLNEEHICCAISNNNDPQVKSKKEWLKQRLNEGLTFIKSVERGKCFIEYLPSEHAWVPIDATNCMHINCFWVSGSFKGHGYGNDLINACISDCIEKGKSGITCVAGEKKLAFLSDGDFLKKHGFTVVDDAPPFYKLFYYAIDKSAKIPSFKASAKKCATSDKGFSVYYTSDCPFNAKYVPIINNLAKEKGIPFTAKELDKETASSFTVACTNYALFYDGKYITNEIQSEKKFLTLASKLTGKNYL